MAEKLAARDFVDLINGAVDALRLHKEEINAMNVFPVPDGDTGTNMLLTMQAVQKTLGDQDEQDMASVCRAVSQGSLMGARGNSGVVLSQILKGMTEVFGGGEEVDIKTISEALSRGSEVAYRAVMKPVEGTILTVVREAAEEGRRVHENCGSLEEWFACVIWKAREALEHTPDLLPVLKEAGVVDAGGRGLLAIFEGMLARLTGEDLGTVEEEVGPEALHPFSQLEDYRYEAQFILNCRDSKIDGFREKLNGLGGSVLVVGGDRFFRVHVHTDRLGEVIEEASKVGRLSEVEITDLILQVEEMASAKAEVEKPIGVVAVAVGEGIKEILRSMDVDLVVDGGQSMNPSTAEILEAVNSLPQDQVLLIPNNKNIIPAAEQTRELTKKEVVVVPAHSITEGFSCMVAFDPRQSMEENRQRIMQAMARVKTGAVTTAIRDSKCGLGKIKKGSYIGLFRGEIVAANGDPVISACSLLEKMIDGEDELVTVIVGRDAEVLDHGAIMDILQSKDLEVELLHGGQPVYQYVFGVE